MLLAALTVPELASKPFIRKALQSPNSPASVLSFFFGVDYYNDTEYRTSMRDGTPLGTMNSIWFGSGDDGYDAMCRHFIPTIRSVVGGSNNEDLGDDERTLWNDSVDGLMSQVLLCDQLSRNAFRGTDEAFRYDSVGEKLAKNLVHHYLTAPDDDDDDYGIEVRPTQQHVRTRDSVPGEFYPPYCAFLVTTLMHSENIENLDLASDVIQESIGRFRDREVFTHFLNYQIDLLADHRAVVERFGRYPHRNSKLGRFNTPEEQAWLDDAENLPGWAKSQG
jgi:uncharacterized protein (DUF924 family)